MIMLLPPEKNFLSRCKTFLSDTWFQGLKSARTTALAYRENNKDLISYYEKRDEEQRLFQKSIEEVRIRFQALSQEKSLLHQLDLQERNLSHQEKQADLNRILQKELSLLNQIFSSEQNDLNRRSQFQIAYLNRELQANEGRLNRELQEKITVLNQVFQANQGQLNREHALLLEEMRAEMQAWQLQEQKFIQLQLSERNADLQRELASYQRETILKNIQEQRRQQNWPLRLDPEQIQEYLNSESLLIIFIPPTLEHDPLGSKSSSNKEFPNMEVELTKQLKLFVQKYEQEGRSVDFIDGAWISKSLKGSAAYTTLFGCLRAKPTLIVNLIVEEDKYHIEVTYWDSSSYKPYTAFFPNGEETLSWKQYLFDIAKGKTERWNEGRRTADNSEIYDQEWGLAAEGFKKNLKLIEREKKIIERGQNPKSLIDLSYFIPPDAYEDLKLDLSTSLKLLVGLRIDEYFLLHTSPAERKVPILPDLISDLINDENSEEIIEILIRDCKNIYRELGKEESFWEPELVLDLALSLSELEDQSWSLEILSESFVSWLSLRSLKLPEDLSLANLINEIKAHIFESDLGYLCKICKCLEALGKDDEAVNLRLFVDQKQSDFAHKKQKQELVKLREKAKEVEEKQAEETLYKEQLERENSGLLQRCQTLEQEKNDLEDKYQQLEEEYSQIKEELEKMKKEREKEDLKNLPKPFDKNDDHGPTLLKY
jgi:hypothetical protein